MTNEYLEKMDNEEYSLAERATELFDTFCAELPSMSFHEQKQAITDFSRKKEAWERKAQSLGMFNLMYYLRDLKMPEPIDYISKEAIEKYIEQYPDHTRLDCGIASEFFNPYCRQRHGSDFERERCMNGHLKDLRDYFSKRIQEEEQQRLAAEKAKEREYTIRMFFGGE